MIFVVVGCSWIEFSLLQVLGSSRVGMQPMVGKVSSGPIGQLDSVLWDSVKRRFGVRFDFSFEASQVRSLWKENGNDNAVRGRAR